MSERRFGLSTGAYYPGETGPAAAERARGEAWPYVEVFVEDRAALAELNALAATDPSTLDAFERVSVHAPIAPLDIELLVTGFDTILHPDRYPDATALGERAVFENMDANKEFGCTVEDMATVFERNPSAGFCLDVAHVWTNDRSLALGHELLDAFGDRLRQLHVSGIEPNCDHRETTDADLALYEPLLARCGHVPWILEALRV